jgi:hypothetical protein
MTLQTCSLDPAAPASSTAPTAEGADLLIKTGPHDEGFWNRHPDVARCEVTMRADRSPIDDWTVLIWLKPGDSPPPAAIDTNGAIPPRSADAEFVVHSVHDMGFFSRHPDLVAWRISLSLNEDGPAGTHYVQVWMASPIAT